MSISLQRREFIAGLGGAASWPLPAIRSGKQAWCGVPERE